jgi:hypothetical protein
MFLKRKFFKRGGGWSSVGDIPGKKRRFYAI